jgi:N-methylhydantoinase B
VDVRERVDQAVDPITLEVIRGGLLSIGDEISNLMIRAGGLDLSAGICDANGRLVAAGQNFVHPVQLGALPVAIAATFQQIPPDAFKPGDVVISNDVFVAGGSHLPDVLLLAPIFSDGERVAFLGARTHWMDIGGNTPGSVEMLKAREIYGDGLRIPPIKIYHEGVLDDDLLSLITLNTRNQAQRRLDFARQVGSCQIGMQRVKSICDKYGPTVFKKALQHALDYTERRLRAIVSELPDGVYRADDWVEIDGIRERPLRLAVTATISGDGIAIDLQGTDAQLPFVGFNAPFGPTNAMVLYAVKCALGPDIPLNDAFQRVISVAAPKGTAVNAQPPAACGGVTGGTELVSRLTEVVIAALAQAAPDRVVASCGSHVLVSLHGIDPDPDRRKLFGRDEGVAQLMLAFELHRSGYGARPSLDGVTSISAYIGNDSCLTCEEIEIRSPLRIGLYEIREDSAGAGRTRGGFGVRRSFEVLSDDVAVTFLVGHSKTKPYGLFGGTAGMSARVRVEAPDGHAADVEWAETRALSRGTRFTVESAGGGGYGPPAERPIAAVLNDVGQGYYGLEVAQSVYGVVIDSAGECDEAKTKRKRADMSRREPTPIDRGASGPYAQIDPGLGHRWAADRAT